MTSNITCRFSLIRTVSSSAFQFLAFQRNNMNTQPHASQHRSAVSTSIHLEHRAMVCLICRLWADFPIEHRVHAHMIFAHDMASLVYVASDDPWFNDVYFPGHMLDNIIDGRYPAGFSRWQSNDMFGMFCRPCYSLQWHAHYQRQPTFIVVGA